MADESEPRGPISGLWPIMFGKYPPHEIFVDVDAKSPRDFLGDSGGAEFGISALHLHNQLDEFCRRSLGPWLASCFGGVE